MAVVVEEVEEVEVVEEVEEECPAPQNSTKAVARIYEKLEYSKNFAHGSSEGYAAILS